jgi:rhomboid family GlyGly-CTERM serine protease
MGLRQVDSKQQNNGLISAWLPVIVISAAMILVGFFGDTARGLLSLDRPAVAAGEVWRLLSAHFVHLGPSHLILNLVGLWLIWYLVGSCFSAARWIFVFLLSIAGVNLGLWYLLPQLQWYVGLSGVLHGLLAAGIVGGLRQAQLDTWVLAAALVAKIAWEQLVGPLPGSEATSGGAVIVDAHLYGAIGGALAACLIAIRVRAKAAI